MKKYYSDDDCSEAWRNTDLNDSVSEYIDENSVESGEIITLYQGDLKTRSPEAYLPYLADIAGEGAYDDHGEVSEDWLAGLESNLQKDFESWFHNWCEVNNQIPEFGSIINIKPIEIRILDPEQYDWELAK